MGHAIIQYVLLSFALMRHATLLYVLLNFAFMRDATLLYVLLNCALMGHATLLYVLLNFALMRHAHYRMFSEHCIHASCYASVCSLELCTSCVMLRYCMFSWALHSCVMHAIVCSLELCSHGSLRYCMFSCVIVRCCLFPWTLHSCLMLRYVLLNFALMGHAKQPSVIQYVFMWCWRSSLQSPDPKSSWRTVGAALTKRQLNTCDDNFFQVGQKTKKL